MALYRDVDFNIWLRKHHTAMVTVGLRMARSACGSNTLRKSMKTVVLDAGLGNYRKGMTHSQHTALFVPHFWAKFYHDGTGNKVPTRSKYMVYFRDPAKDPRIATGYPVNPSDVKSFYEMPAHWRYWLGKQRAARRAKSTPPMLFKKRVGKAPAHPFFDNDWGMAGFDTYVRDKTKVALNNYVIERFVKNKLTNKTRTVTRIV